jgi:hypothetical protein
MVLFFNLNSLIYICRIIGNKTFKATTWSVIFKLETVLTGNYTLQLALASASNAEVQVH